MDRASIRLAIRVGVSVASTVVVYSSHYSLVTFFSCVDLGWTAVLTSRGSSCGRWCVSPSPRCCACRCGACSMSVSVSMPSSSSSLLCASSKRARFLSRLRRGLRHMDLEAASLQLLQLMTQPSHSFRHASYRKRTKAHFARDDPAFLMLTLSLASVLSFMLGLVVLHLTLFDTIKFTLLVLLVDMLAVGLAVATIGWFVANRMLKDEGARIDEDVEWAFAFDVHFSAIVPLLLTLHGGQLLLYHVLLKHNFFISTLFGNLLWLLSSSYYVYVTFVGYSSLQLRKCHVILHYPIMLLAIVFIVCTAANINLARAIIQFYVNRVL